MKAKFNLPKKNLCANFNMPDCSMLANFEMATGTKNYERLENKPSINGVELIGNKTSIELGLATSAQGALAESALQEVPSYYVTETELASELLTKQNVINDLSEIREGASLGATSVQPDDISDMATKTWVEGKGYTSNIGTVTSVNSVQPDTNGNVVISVPQQVNADWNATSGVAEILNKPTIPTDTGDLTNNAGYIKGISGLDVTNALGYVPYNSSNPSNYITSSALNGYATENWVVQQDYLTGITGSQVTNALGYTPVNPSNLSNVATSGSYNDLSNKPTIGNGTVTFTQGGVTKGTITMNQSGDTTIALEQGSSGTVTDVEVNGESVVTDGVAEIDLTGYQEKLLAGTDLEILTGGGAVVYELPQGYAQIEYIESSGAQALNTGVSGYSTITLDAQGAQTSSASQVVVGTYSGFNSFFGQYANTSAWSGNSTSNGFNTGIPYTTRTKLVINFGEGGVYRVTTENGTTYTSTSSGKLLTSANFYLFRTGTGNAYYSKTRIYYCKIEQSGVKKAELIPAIRLSDNAIGMYDIVQNVFRTNLGTGTFIAGEKVVESSIINFTNDSGYVKSSELAEVATTGDYGDLINTPTIGNGTIIVNEGATEKGRFTLNQNGDTTINLTQVGAGMITFMQDGKQSGRVSANRTTDMTITLKGLYDYESVNADMVGDNLEQANNNRVTGFSSSDYIVMREPITLPQYWEYDVDFSIGELADDIGEDQYIFSDKNNTFALKENEDNTLYETFTLYVNGTAVASNIEAESAYYNIKFIKGMDESYNIVGSGNTLQCYVYIGFSSGQSAQKELVGSFTSSTAPTAVQTIFGVNSNHAQPLSDGSYIDFTKCFIDGITRNGNTVTKTRIWDGLVKTIDTKADAYLSNITDAGKITIADMSMPSTQYKTLTLGASGAQYTAPSDGWFVLKKQSGSGSTQYLNLYNRSANDLGMTMNSGGASIISTVFVPAKKGQTVEAVYNYSGTTNFFRFIYAVGSESEAT